jgi:hypothetical protein
MIFFMVIFLKKSIWNNLLDLLLRKSMERYANEKKTTTKKKKKKKKKKSTICGLK